jgi:putative hemolysin
MSLLKIILLLFCLLFSAFFSGMETGVISLNHLRLRHLVRKRNRDALILSRFLAEPDRLLGTILVGNNLFNISASVLTSSLFVLWFGAPGAWLAGPAATLALLVFGEYLPKSWMAARPARRSLPLARPLRLAGLVLGPLERAATWAAGLFFPIPKSYGGNFYKPITRDDLVHLTHSGHKTGQLTAVEMRMINAVFALRGKRCADIMVPRKQMAYCLIDSPATEILDLARAKGFNRFPVFQPESGDFVGIIYIFDLLKCAELEGRTAADFMQAPQFIASDAPVDQIVPRMRLTRQPFLLVNDRISGDTVGMIALNEFLKWLV